MPNQTDPQWAIEGAGLTKTYGSTKVLDEAGLRVAPGSVFSLLGPNGAGKTTMVRILSTLLRPDAGRARVAGFDIIRDRHQVLGSISLTGQYAALDPLLTGAENLRMMARLSGLRGAAAGRRADELLARFGLVSSPEAANAFIFVPMIMAYASSAFVPVRTMPPWLHGVAGHQPATPVIETMRGLLLATHVGANGWQAVAWCGGIFVVSVGLSAAAFRRRTR
jgi:hypothetical protein